MTLTQELNSSLRSASPSPRDFVLAGICNPGQMLGLVVAQPL